MSLSSVAETFQRALEAEPIGTPVAARLLLYGTPDPDDIDSQLVEAIALLQEWFAAAPADVRMLGDLAHGERTALVRFEAGQTALISSGVSADPSFQVTAMLIGSRGILSYDLTKPAASAAPATAAAEVIADLQRSDEQTQLRWDGLPVRSPAAAVPSRRSEPPFGVLLVAGDHTHQPTYASAFAADSRCRLIAVTDGPDLPDERLHLNRGFADRLGLPYLDDYGQALQRSDVDIVSICAEPYRRGSLIRQAAAVGKHLYLDKPLCGSQAELGELIREVREAGTVAQMYSQVYWSAAQRAKELLASGRLGLPVAIHVDLCFAKGNAGALDEIAPRRETGNPTRFELWDAKRELTNIGVYGIVCLQWLLQQEVASVAAATGNYFFAEHQRRDFEDFGQLLLGFSGGVTGSICAGRTGWHSHAHEGINRIHLLGTRGTATVDANQPRCELWSPAATWEPQINPNDPMGMWPPVKMAPAAPKKAWTLRYPSSAADDVRKFIDCVENNTQSDVSIERAASASEVLFAAYESAATGKTIRFARETE